MGWPILGEALAYARSPHRFIESRAKRHGPIFKTRILGSRVICFVGAEPFDFFANNPDFVRTGGAPGHVQKLLGYSSLPLVDGPAHSSLREKVSLAVRPEAQSSYLAQNEILLGRYMKRWETLGEFAWADEFKLFSAGLCLKLILGEESNFADDEALAGTLDEYISGLNAFPINLRFNAYGKALKRQNQLLEMIGTAVAKHSPPAKTKEKSMLSWLAEPGESGDLPISAPVIRAQLLHLLFATYGGMSRILPLLTMNLAQYADVRNRVEHEIAPVPQENASSIEALVGLEYLNAVTKEVRRHNRLFATNFFSKVIQPSTVEGYEIPEGWIATGAIYQTMQDEAVFPEPGRFDPGRFADSTVDSDAVSKAYIPHGGGSESGHRCPAEDFTTLCMQQVALMLLRSHQWEMLEGQDLSLTGGPSPMPRDGIRVQFRRRTG